MASLPKSMGLKSIHNAKYLRCFFVADIEHRGVIQSSGDEVVTPYSIFKVEPAKTGNGSYVHIRSVYNNKYWVRRSETQWWIVAGADEPNEDQSSWTCTLFKPSFLVENDSNSIKLLHVQLGQYASIQSYGDYNSCLIADSATPDKNNRDVFAVTNLETLFVLPQRITFIGDNGLYLKGIGLDNHPYLQFSSTNANDSSTWYETLFNNDGSVHVKSDSFAKFWRRNSDNWILADAHDTINSDTSFSPTRVEATTVAFLNLGNKKYCKRLTAKKQKDCLAADDSTITKEAKMKVEETVSSRLITVAEHKEMDKRSYNKSKIILATETVTNHDDKPKGVEFTLSFPVTKTEAWNSTVSSKILSKVTLEDEVDPHRVFQDYKLGDIIETTTQESINLTATLPAKSTIIVNYIATKSSNDVPFSYTQHDTLLDGKQITSNFEDGLFTFTSLSDFKSETTIIPHEME